MANTSDPVARVVLKLIYRRKYVATRILYNVDPELLNYPLTSQPLVITRGKQSSSQYMGDNTKTYHVFASMERFQL